MAAIATGTELKGSGVTIAGDVSTAGQVIICREPAAWVIVQNNDATGTNVLWAAVNSTASATNGIQVPGAAAVREFFLTYGDYISLFAAAGRATVVVATIYRA